MSLPAIFANFVQQSPVTVMMRGILERVMSPEKLDELFEQTAQNQYTRELLFSKELGSSKSELVPGYRVKICDGNALSGTEHRLLVLRDTSAGALPGKCLVVLDKRQDAGH